MDAIDVTTIEKIQSSHDSFKSESKGGQTAPKFTALYLQLVEKIAN